MASPDFKFSGASMYSMDVACFLMILLLSAFVRKIVLALDTDSQPVQLDFILQPQTRHVDVLHFAYSMSMENGVAFASVINSGFTANPNHTSCSGPILLLTLPLLLLLHCCCTASALLLHCFWR